jgi:hypothetical protein
MEQVSQFKIGAAAAALALGLLAGQAQAHHSFAMFDRTHDVVLKGTVREFQWTNPHSFIELDVVDDKGAIGSYSIEMNSPNNLTRQGWKSSALKPGDKVVTAGGFKLRNGMSVTENNRVVPPTSTTPNPPNS